MSKPRKASEIPGFLAELDAHIAFAAARPGDSKISITLELPTKHAAKYACAVASDGRVITSEAAQR